MSKKHHPSNRRERLLIKEIKDAKKHRPGVRRSAEDPEGKELEDETVSE